MRVITDCDKLRRLCGKYRAAGKSIGFVPTMGAFHAGHLSLMRRARQENDIVAVSIFVNPLQFAAGEDLAAYPRDFAGDKKSAGREQVDVIFAPLAGEFYPAGFSGKVLADSGLNSILEGARRPTHFDGVCTVLARLFNLVAAHRVYLGQKDYQQFLVVKRLVEGFAFDLELVICPIVRDRDGLALSSRNVYLDSRSRGKALVLSETLKLARSVIELGERDPAKVVSEMRQRFSLSGVELDYITVAGAEDLQPVKRVSGDVLIAVAAKVGGVRLIDNELLLGV